MPKYPCCCRSWNVVEFYGRSNYFWKIPFLGNERSDFCMVGTTNNFFVYTWWNMFCVAEVHKILDCFWVGCFKENFSNVMKETTNIGVGNNLFVSSIKFIREC